MITGCGGISAAVDGLHGNDKKEEAKFGAADLEGQWKMSCQSACVFQPNESDCGPFSFTDDLTINKGHFTRVLQLWSDNKCANLAYTQKQSGDLSVGYSINLYSRGVTELNPSTTATPITDDMVKNLNQTNTCEINTWQANTAASLSGDGCNDLSFVPGQALPSPLNAFDFHPAGYAGYATAQLAFTNVTKAGRGSYASSGSFRPYGYVGPVGTAASNP